MIDCNELIEDLHAKARDHVHLAILAEATPIAEMHLNLAMFSEEQAQVAGELCEDANAY